MSHTSERENDMLEPTPVIVNGRTYLVQPMNPIQILDFIHEYNEEKAKIAGFDKNGNVNRSAIIPRVSGVKAIRQCVDSEGRQLSEPKHFTACFESHPEDMIILETLALDAIVSPFFPRQEPTTKNVVASLKK